MKKSSDKINSIVIVGGGSAGWITACILAKKFDCSDQANRLQITVVESPDIPIVGVGEGTWPTMRRTLEAIGVCENDFIRNCQATFKQGTQFFDWKNNSQNSRYFNLFSSIFDPSDFNLAPYWMMSGAKEGLSYADAVSAQGYACENFLAPKRITSKAFEAHQSYAYHLDAGRFSEFLKDHAIKNLGVNLTLANVVDAQTCEEGYLTAVVTREGSNISGDFFIDCTGFKSLLIGEKLGVNFNELGDILPNDRAVTMQVPYQDPNQEIACVTKSTAREAGWIWDIGLQTRRGVGYVYSSSFLTDDQAEQTLRSYVGLEADNLSARVIPMKVGRREKFWHKNCLAIGLSAAFIEPLEASAIFLIEAAANMMSDIFPASRSAMSLSADMFNQSFDFRWTRTIDFIKMHYVLSQRSDTDYWLAARELSGIPDSLQAKLDLWEQRPISKYDFSDINEPFPFESYQYVLYGMGRVPKDLPATMYTKANMANERFQQVKRARELICDGLPKHRELINQVCQFGFQSI